MSCFSCFSSQDKKSAKKKSQGGRRVQSEPALITKQSAPDTKKPKVSSESTNKRDTSGKLDNGNIAAQIFTFHELAAASKNFRQECLIGEGGFGRVYKGRLENSGQLAAIKQLDRNGLQGNKEFLVEVLMLSSLHHKNLVNLIGYCADGEQRLLVYEYMSMGSVEDHLLDLSPGQKPLNWYARMKIATGAARGIEYLHYAANPPVIYRDLKSSNILLDEEFNPKLSDFGLAKLGPTGDKTHVSSRVMGTYGYCAPEYARTGQLTLKSDVYSFGVVLLELITGRRAFDTTRPIDEQNLITWAQPYLKDPSKYLLMVDPLLEEDYPVRDLNQAVAVAAMCIQEEPEVRPLMNDVVAALSFLVVATPNRGPPAPSFASSSTSNDDDERRDERAVAEAMEWGENSQEAHKNSQGGSGGVSF